MKAEDYALWSDLADKGEFYNIPQVLLKYRLSPTQISAKQENPSAIRLQKNYINKWLNSFNLEVDFSKNEEVPSQLYCVLNSLRNKCDKRSAEFKNLVFITYTSFLQNRYKYLLCSILKGDLFRLSLLNIIRYVQIVLGQRQPKIWE